MYNFFLAINFLAAGCTVKIDENEMVSIQNSLNPDKFGSFLNNLKVQIK